MRFTLIALGVPVLLFLLDMATGSHGGLGAIGLVWLWIAFPLTGYYWIARIVRRAWRDSSRAHNRIT